VVGGSIPLEIFESAAKFFFLLFFFSRDIQEYILIGYENVYTCLLGRDLLFSVPVSRKPWSHLCLEPDCFHRGTKSSGEGLRFLTSLLSLPSLLLSDGRRSSGLPGTGRRSAVTGAR